MNTLSDKEQVLDLIRGIPPLPLHGPAPDGLEGAKLSLARWLGRTTRSALLHPRIALFAGTGSEGCLAALTGGAAPLCGLCRIIDADLRVYELTGTPMTEETEIHATAYGMMAVEPGVDMIVLGGCGDISDPEEKATIKGAIIAARLASIPVILDGATALSALFDLCDENPAMAEHCATTWQPPQTERQWFREHTALQFLPASGHSEPGMEGGEVLRLALSL